jgi:hypothetical protein
LDWLKLAAPTMPRCLRRQANTAAATITRIERLAPARTDGTDLLTAQYNQTANPDEHDATIDELLACGNATIRERRGFYQSSGVQNLRSVFSSFTLNAAGTAS